MSRPLRIEYENAYYHVMNRGRSRLQIFHGEEYYQSFLSTLGEVHSRFGLHVLCYCLMGNHYHLLVKTPRGNLGRCMRHLNGVYTQRYNRLRKTDGPLFRGRYKAILVEEESYQLQLSRYIHRNPLEAQLVQKLESYPWSSYPVFLRATSRPAWLYPDDVLDQMGAKRLYRERYRAYVEQGVDEEIRQFYSRGNVLSVLGSQTFREEMAACRNSEEMPVGPNLAERRPITEIVIAVANYYEVSPETITRARRGRGEKNIPRWIAMYLCQELEDYRLNDIAPAFNLSRYATVSTTIAKLKRLRVEARSVDRAINRIVLDLTP